MCSQCDTTDSVYFYLKFSFRCNQANVVFALMHCCMGAFAATFHLLFAEIIFFASRNELNFSVFFFHSNRFVCDDSSAVAEASHEHSYSDMYICIYREFVDCVWRSRLHISHFIVLKDDTVRRRSTIACYTFYFSFVFYSFKWHSNYVIFAEFILTATARCECKLWEFEMCCLTLIAVVVCACTTSAGCAWDPSSS